MKAATFLYKDQQLLPSDKNGLIDRAACQLVLAFGSKALLAEESFYVYVRGAFPNAHIALASTAGEIFGPEVFDHSVSLVAVQFHTTTVKTISFNINGFPNSYEAGAALVKQLPSKSLRYIFILSDGSLVNGSELVRGMESIVKHTIPITGGLAADGGEFASTLVGLNEQPSTGNIVAIGFYGDSFSVSHGSKGGWDVFGLERTVTKSTGNRLYEIDGKNAIILYKEYLGKYAEELPGSALLFPLSVQLRDSSEPIVRTILSIDNEDQCMVFAGDIPQGSTTRFMKANYDKVIDAAVLAAQSSVGAPLAGSQKVAILISCVGRKLILGKRVDEEVEAVCEALGPDVLVTGFYSYGEISPLSASTQCELLNQTMTITSFEEL